MFELVLMAPEERLEELGDALDALDALSVSVEDADAQTDAEQALFGEPGMPAPKGGWNRPRVVALVQHEQQAREAAERLLREQRDHARTLPAFLGWRHAGLAKKRLLGRRLGVGIFDRHAQRVERIERITERLDARLGRQ